jgi:SPP1 gp7 family putative phage head morphogenesis protein
MTHRTKAVARGESRLSRKLAALLARAGKEAASAALKQLGMEKADPGDARRAEEAAAAAASGVDWTLLIDPTEEQLAQVALDGAKRALMELGITDKGITEQVYADAVAWARDRAAEMVGMRYNAAGDLVENPLADMAITADVREAIREQVANALEQGLPADELADNIMDLTEFSADRATTIARTEIIRANNQGHLNAFKGSGVVKEKEWSTAEDGDVCDECTDNEADGPIGLDDSFSSGDDAAPAHPNCRCTIVAVVEQSEDDGGDEDQGDDESD